MVAALTFVLLTQSVSGVRTSLGLWQGPRPPEDLRAADQWLCYDFANPNPVLEKFARLSKDSPEALGKPSTQAQINRWMTQLPTSTHSDQAFKEFLTALPAISWPTSKPGDSRWFRCKGTIVTGVESPADKKLIAFATVVRGNRAEGEGTVYLRLRKTEEGLAVGWIFFNRFGKFQADSRQNIPDYLATTEVPGEKIDLGAPAKIEPADFEVDTIQPTHAKLLSLQEISATGFAKHVFTMIRFKPGRAILFRDAHWLKILRIGGSISAALNNYGYRSYRVGNTTVILPPFISRRDGRNLAERIIVRTPQESANQLVSRFQNWFQSSNIQTYDDTSELIGAIAKMQSGFPDLTECYPFWNVVRLTTFPVLDRQGRIDVLGSSLGSAADKDLAARLISTSKEINVDTLQPGFSEEQGVGFHFSPNGTDHVKAITYKTTSETRYFFPESRVLAPLDFGGFARNYTVVVNEKNLDQTKLQVVRGFSIDFSAHTLSGQEFPAKLFYEVRREKLIAWKDLPKSERDALLEARRKMTEGNDSTLPPSP